MPKIRSKIPKETLLENCMNSYFGCRFHIQITVLVASLAYTYRS